MTSVTSVEHKGGSDVFGGEEDLGRIGEVYVPQAARVEAEAPAVEVALALRIGGADFERTIRPVAGEHRRPVETRVGEIILQVVEEHETRLSDLAPAEFPLVFVVEVLA